MAANTSIETEVKIRIGDVEEIEARLRVAGFEACTPRLFETNELWDTADRGLKAGTEVLRLRNVGGKCILTYKGKPQTGKHKSREELESEISTQATIQRVFERMGLTRVFRYDKHRTEYKRAAAPGVVTVDETPIGNFIEIEGEGEWIDRVATELGFDEADYVTKSYGALYVEHCAAQGLEPSNMVF